MAHIDEFIERARKTPKTVALPECDSEDAPLAARRVADDGIGTPVLADPADVIAQTAGRASAVTGRANVLVFPDLNCANGAVKLIRILTHGKGYGHNLSGLMRPVAYMGAPSWDGFKMDGDLTDVEA